MKNTPAAARPTLAIFSLAVALAIAPPPARAAGHIVVDGGFPTRYIEPLQDLPDASNPMGWTARDYALAADAGKGDTLHGNGSGGWQWGSHGLGFGDGDDVTLLEPKGGIPSVYTRSEFELDDPAAIRGMTLDVDYDDGYVAWLNGVEIARSPNMAGIEPRWNAKVDTHESGFMGVPMDLTKFVPLLVPGKNVLALACWNIGGDDMTLNPRLTLHDEPLPTPADPFHCYLTWQGNLSTSMTVNYHTRAAAEQSWVYYDTVPRHGVVADYAQRMGGASHQIDVLEPYTVRRIHVVELTGLVPGQTYYFIAGDPVTGFTKERSFRTVPEGNLPIRFVTGGDLEANPYTFRLLQHAAALDPMFMLFGGDIAYADGKLTSWMNWEACLNAWEKYLVAPDGRMIPMIHAIGNHDLNRAKQAPYYYGYLAQEGRYADGTSKSYFARTAGANTLILALDSDHMAPSDGEQLAWMKAQFEQHKDVRYKFAIYHVPLYPAHRDYAAAGNATKRQRWLPLFDAYGLTAGFENHDHVYKRTKRMKHNRPDPAGTLYIGDGCMGVEPRPCDQGKRLEDPAELEKLGLDETYLARYASRYNFILVEVPRVSERGIPPLKFTAIDENGEIFDTVTLP